MYTGKSIIKRTAAFVLAAALSGFATVAAYGVTPTSVSIGTGPASPDGTYLNAVNMANTLAFTNVTVQATSNIDVVDNLDLSNSPSFGPTFGNLVFESPTLNLNNNLNMGGGDIGLTSVTTLNLTGKFTFNSALFPASRVFNNSTVTQVNILANTASIQQGIDISSASSPVTVNVSTGQYNENISIARALTLASTNVGGQTNNGNFSITNSAATAKITGSSFTNASGATIGGIGTLDVSGVTGSTLTNDGTVAPGSSPGILTLTGNYSQDSGGELDIEIGGTAAGTGYDRLALSGTASLNGLLHASLINSFVPTSSETFTILTATSLSGDFSNAPTTLTTDSGLFDVTYTPTSVVLGNFRPLPEPAGLTVVVLGAATLLRRRKKAGHLSE